MSPSVPPAGIPPWPFLKNGDVGVQVIAGNLRDRLVVRPLFITPAMIGEYLELAAVLGDLGDAYERESSILREAWVQLLAQIPPLKGPLS
jgi:hypothetical protein